MAFESIYNSIIAKRVVLQSNLNGTDRTLLQIDCTRGEYFTATAQVAGHPVEDGSLITDHVIDKGRTLVIEGTISDTPINLNTAMVGNAAGLLGGALSGPARSIATAAGVILGNKLVAGGGAKASKTAFDIFAEIHRQKLPLTIVSGLAAYTNMVMESLYVPRTARNAGALEFKAGFKEIRIVASESVGVPKEAMSDDSRDLGSTEKQNGRQQAQQLESAEEKKVSSLLYKMTIGDQ